MSIWLTWFEEETTVFSLCWSLPSNVLCPCRDWPRLVHLCLSFLYCSLFSFAPTVHHLVLSVQRSLLHPSHFLLQHWLLFFFVLQILWAFIFLQLPERSASMDPNPNANNKRAASEGNDFQDNAKRTRSAKVDLRFLLASRMSNDLDGSCWQVF